MRKEARLCRCGLERGPRAGASVARRTIDGLALAEVGIVGRREDAATVPAQQALEVAVIYVGEKLRCSGRAELISTAWPQVVDRGSGGGSGPIFRPRAAGWPRRLAELSTVDSAAHHDFLSQRLVKGGGYMCGAHRFYRGMDGGMDGRRVRSAAAMSSMSTLSR